VLADVVASQHEVHWPYGGVVPELASRAHVVNVVPVLDQALVQAGVGLDEIDGIAVTYGPGLVGALLVAVQTAKALAWARGIPLIGVHHLEGHLSAIYLEPAAPPMPHLALIVSGGHTSLVRVDGTVSSSSWAAPATTRPVDFDKGAKLLGLGYPAAPSSISSPRVAIPRRSRCRGR
jgi:N6-L-threonylcarbamoyladenine synthase